MSNEKLSGLQLQPAWKRADATIVRDAKEFWSRLTQLGEQEMERRTSELCAAAYSEGRLVGVATAYVERLDILRGRFAMFRCLVDPGAEQSPIARRLALLSRDQLERWSLENPSEKVLGMAAVIPGSQYREEREVPVWAEDGLNLNLVGYMAPGAQIRVSWFAHARLGESAAPSIH